MGSYSASMHSQTKKEIEGAEPFGYETPLKIHKRIIHESRNPRKMGVPPI